MDQVLIHARVWSKNKGRSKIKPEDELFEKLRKITETEVKESELFFAH
jgi:hypothetical protein